MSKVCKKCGVSKEATLFYNKDSSCKECRKKRVRENRLDNVEYYREFDRRRGNRQRASYQTERRSEYPNKYKAHTIVNNSIRDGKLIKRDCEVCGRVDTHAHHNDYSKPLDVSWLCPPCHFEWHSVNGEGLNG